MPLTHAEKYKLRIIWYWYPLYCLGGISFLSFIILVITGTVLGIYYVPGGEGDPSPAYASMEFIMLELPFGYIIRAVHHWGTHFMVASVFLHMCRVYFTGAYRNPRELNWLIGVALMALTIVFGYSGYLLPWDSLAYGAAVIGINLANSSPLVGKYIATLLFGGSSLTPRTVTRMYFIHVFILPVIVTKTSYTLTLTISDENFTIDEEVLIEKGHAKLLASLNPKEAEKAAENIIKNKLSVKDLNKLSNPNSLGSTHK